MIPEYVSHFIGGGHVRSSFLKSFAGVDPATGREYTQVAVGLGADINQAVLAARAALEDGPWPAMGAAERAGVLEDLAAAVDARAGQITAAEVTGTGLPASAAGAQVTQAAACFRAAAAQLREPDGDPDGDPVAGPAGSCRERRPAGIAGVITPWRSPFLAQARAVAPALAAGCAVVLKPDELAPLPAWQLAQTATAAGLPGGVLNIVHGSRHPRAPGAQARDALLEHPGIPVISFAGDPAAAAAVTAAAAAHGKQLHAEVTGSAPCVILADADLDAAADSALFGAFWLNGQRRTASSRILAQRGVYRELVSRLAGRAGRIRTGPPELPGTEVGPVVHAECYEQLRSWVRLGLREGARVAAGGRAPAELPGGSYLAPTVLADVEPSMRVFGGHVRGPVLSVTPFDDPGEAVSAVRAMTAVPAVYLWTADVPQARLLAAQIGACATWVNAPNTADDMARGAGIGFFSRVHEVHVAAGDKPVPLLGRQPPPG